MSLLVEFDYGTLQAYERSSKYIGTLFFTEDTHQLFKGDHEITKTAKVVDSLPSIDDGEYGSLYIKMPERIPYVFNGLYVPIIREYTDSLDGADDDSIPTSKSVIDYLERHGGSSSSIDIISNSEIDAMF